MNALRVRDEEDVVGLEVAVDEAGAVSGFEPGGDLVEDEAGLGGGDRAALHPLAKRLALEEVHHEIAAAVGEGSEREDIDDVGVADPVDRPRLLDEALDGRGVVRQLGLEDLDRRALADHRMRRGVDDAHATATELALDDVTADIDSDEGFVVRVHARRF